MCIYDIVAAILPFYVAMLLGYASIRWWKIFTPNQSTGINRFVAMFAIPIYAFYFVSPINPYHMNTKFIAADTLQKIVILVALFLWNKFTKPSNGIDWIITLFSLSTLPNTLVSATTMSSMYESFTTSFLIQIAILQGVLWNNVLLFLYEYRAAKILLPQQIVNVTEGSTKSSKEEVELNIESLNNSEPLQKSISAISDSLSRATKLDGVTLLKIEKKRFWRSNSCPTSVNPTHLVSINATHQKESKNGEHKSDDGKGYILSEGKKEENIEKGIENKEQQMAVIASGMTKLILRQVWRKLIRNPNIYAVFFGFIWSLISYRWNIKMPSVIISNSIAMMSKAGFGMIFFGLGVSMGLQPKIIACEKTSATISLAMKFLVGPAVMAATSFMVGIRGVLLQVSIVQAAFPEAIAPFVFAGQHDLHEKMHNTAVIFGLIVGLPISIIYYYMLLGL